MKIIAETALTSVLFGIFIFLQVSSDPLHFAYSKTASAFPSRIARFSTAWSFSF
jgi:hypothetical protein